MSEKDGIRFFEPQETIEICGLPAASIKSRKVVLGDLGIAQLFGMRGIVTSLNKDCIGVKIKRDGITFYVNQDVDDMFELGIEVTNHIPELDYKCKVLIPGKSLLVDFDSRDNEQVDPEDSPFFCEWTTHNQLPKLALYCDADPEVLSKLTFQFSATARS